MDRRPSFFVLFYVFSVRAFTYVTTFQVDFSDGHDSYDMCQGIENIKLYPLLKKVIESLE